VERPGFAAAIGSASAVVALLALTGAIDASIIVVALLCVAVRASAAALSGSPLALNRAAASVLPFAALAAVAVWRAGAASLDAIRGANAILGAAAFTAPASRAIATMLAAIAVAVVTAAQSVALREPPPIARLLDRIGVLIAALLIATAIGGPDVDHARSIIAWTVGVVAALLVIRATESLATHPRMRTLAWSLAGIAVVIGAIR